MAGRQEMNNKLTFIIGLVVGLVIGSGIAYAAARVILSNSSGRDIGTTSYPLYIKAQ
jgi:hypothetical protein